MCVCTHSVATSIFTGWILWGVNLSVLEMFHRDFSIFGSMKSVNSCRFLWAVRYLCYDFPVPSHLRGALLSWVQAARINTSFCHVLDPSWDDERFVTWWSSQENSLLTVTRFYTGLNTVFKFLTKAENTMCSIFPFIDRLPTVASSSSSYSYCQQWKLVSSLDVTSHMLYTS